MKLGPSSLALVVGCLLLGACGDDDGDEKKAPLTKAAYVGQGDTICARSNAEFNELFETDFPVIKSATDDFFAKALPIVRDEVADLRALEEPAADKARIAKMLASGDRAVADFERASSDAAYAAKIFIEEGGANATSFDKQARAYGFKKCGTEDEEEEEVKPDRSTFSAPKKSYIAQADAICAAANKRFSRLEERYLMDFPLEIDTWAKFLPRIVEVARPQLEELERLTPPAADKQRIDALLDRQQAVLEKFAEAGKVAGDGDEDAFLEVGRPMFSDSDKLDADLRAYGFRECGAEE